MQKFSLIVVLLLCTTVFYGQHQINGVLLDKTNNTPLPFANVISAEGTGTITDRDGVFILEQQQPFTKVTFSYIGFKPYTITVQDAQSYYKVSLEASVESLGEVVVSAKDNPAIRIIQKTVDNRKFNNPEKALQTFNFDAYSKLLITANPDSISSKIDTVYKVVDGEKKLMFVDSSNYELKKHLTRSHIYISEKISEYQFNQTRGKRENILATRVAGFEEPLYRILALKLQSFSFYDDEYTIFGTSYTNPIATNCLNKYNYRILDTIHGDRDAVMIYFKPKEEGDVAGLQGVLYIDLETYALQKAISQLKGAVDVKAEQNFEYYPEEKVWFPKDKLLRVGKGEGDQAVNMFGGMMTITGGRNKQQNNDSIMHSSPIDDSEKVTLVLTEKNSNIQLNSEFKMKGHGLSLLIEDDAFKKDEAFWNKYRTDSVTTRDKETYVVVDSAVAATGLEKKAKFFLKILDGYIPTKYFDLDLRYLIKYNNYEGFRLGMGLVTNKEFSNIVKLKGYGVYGTRDKKFKYGLGGDIRLDKFTNTWVGGMFIDDLSEVGSHPFITDGRAFYVFQPRLFNIETFYWNKRVQLHLTHNITSKARIKVQASYNDITPKFDYVFSLNGTDYNQYNISKIDAAISWQPYSEFMVTPDGFDQISRGFPTFTFQATKSIPGVLNSDFNFTQLNLRAYYEMQPFEKGKTSFTFNSGMAFGELPVTELYHTSPNNPNKVGIMRRFSVAGIDNFETMYFNEFFSDRYITLMGRHEFKTLELAKRIKPQFSIFTKFAIGDASNQERHNDFQFNTLNQGYYESGMEINNLLYGFGVSGAYRYGPYHLPDVDKNISFKFTFNFSLN